MALRNTKICREIVHNYKQYLSTKAELPLSKADIQHNEQEPLQESPYRYIVTNTKKPDMLPKIVFHKQPEQFLPPEMRYLQPSMLPKFSAYKPEPDVELGENVSTRHFGKPPKTLLVSAVKKDSKMPVVIVNKNFHRNFSSLPFLNITRSSHHKKSCKKKDECPPRPKRCQSGPCPRFHLDNCAQSKGSNCVHEYVDPKCTKQFAPYPSYSESCAERLEADPSECMQCPWQKCGGTDDIRPPKRHYHTATGVHRFNQQQQQQCIPNLLGFDCSGCIKRSPCDDRKQPCKRPLGECEKRKKKNEKCPPKEEKKKVCISNDWTAAYGLWSSKQDIIPLIDPWISTEQPEEYLFDSGDLRRKKFGDRPDPPRRAGQFDNPKCNRQKRKTVPDSCDCDNNNCPPKCDDDTCLKDKKDRCKKCQSFNNVPMYIFKKKDCPKKCPHNECPCRKPPCPRHPITPVDQIRDFDPRFKPIDPCCTEAKKGSKTQRVKPKVYVPEKRDY